ncbi:MAG: iron-sulfur cluster assembly accessory protein [Beggiatoa sp. IS2]|nr:MAG: iron-sulfur cluster assembly accessory protein [Beggiatoa sp. IS2]
MFKITQRAADQILKSAEESNMVGLALRLAASRQPEDGSIQYLIGFDEVQEEDIHITSHGVDIVFDAEYKELLQGAVMDYVEIEESGFCFIFLNPNDPTFVPPSQI